MSTSNVLKPLGGRGSAQDPAGGADSAPQTPSWWGGGSCPPQEPYPLFSLVSFGYASVNYSISLWLADVERTTRECG